MINSINVAKKISQFIYTNSSSAVTGIASSVNKIFNSIINKFIDSFKFTKNTTKCLATCIYTKTSTLINYIFNVGVETRKLPSDAYNPPYNPNYPN